jgi:hypothetical protein
MEPSDATAITVAAGEERTGVDIRAQLIRASTIQGVVTTPVDANVAVDLWLRNTDPSAPDVDDNQVRLRRDGTFTFDSIAPGNYTIFAQTNVSQPQVRVVNGEVVQPQAAVLTNQQRMWGKAHVTVTRESEIPVSVSLQPARSISGIVVFDTAKQSIHPRWLSVSRARVFRRLDRFRTNCVPHCKPTTVHDLRRAGRPPRASHEYQQREVGGRWSDALDSPFEFTGERDVTDAVLTVTDRLSELNGTLTDPTASRRSTTQSSSPRQTQSILGPESRRISMTQPDSEGRFEFNSLPAGSYSSPSSSIQNLASTIPSSFARSPGRRSL